MRRLQPDNNLENPERGDIVMSTSCDACPSCVSSTEAIAVYPRVRLDSDVCVRFGHMLSRPGQPEAVSVRIKKTQAEQCPSFGAPQPSPLPEYPTAQIAAGDLQAIATLGTLPPRERDEIPRTCTGCQYFVTVSAVKSELGWNAGLCAINGRLLPPIRFTEEPKTCPYGRRGEPRDTVMDVLLLPAYDPSIAAAARVQKTSVPPIEPSKHRIDPRDYESDKPIDDDDRRLHIRAWRQVDDPEGRRDPLYLPIFDGPALYGRDPRGTFGKYRPDLYVDHHGALYDLVSEMYEQGKTIILQGPAGTGKTEMACWLAWLMDVEFTRFAIRPNTEPEEIVGTRALIESENGTQVTGWDVGPLPRALTKPGIVDIDEYNASNDDLLFFIRMLLDEGRILLGNEYFEQHPFNFCIATQNPPHDPIYRGVQQISAADFSRVSGMAVGYPPESVERAILTERCKDFGFDLDPVICDKIIQVSTDLRRQCSEGTLMMSWGVRENIDVAIKTNYYSFEKAYRRAATDLLEPQVADIIMASVRSVA